MKTITVQLTDEEYDQVQGIQAACGFRSLEHTVVGAIGRFAATLGFPPHNVFHQSRKALTDVAEDRA